MPREFTFFLWLAKHTYSKWYLRHNHVQVAGFERIDFSKGPFLIISNHCGAYDPIIISSIVPRTVHWVTGAYLFKTKFFNFVFSKVCRCIAKQQGQSDFSTVRAIQRNLKEGNVVGLFPEGTRTWDGNMVSYSKISLAKLIKIFSVSTVFVNLEGCFAQQPRWADCYREGQGVRVNFRKVLTADEIKELDVNSLEKVLTEDFDFSNDEWKKNNDYRFVSTRRAEGLQKFFYMCPVCNGVGTFTTYGDTVECTACKAKAVITEKDDISSEVIDFRYFSQWHEWEKSKIAEKNELKEEKAVLFQTGDCDNNGKLKTVSKNLTVSMKEDSFNVVCEGGKAFVFRLNSISSFILNAKQTMEFVSEGKVYRLRLTPSSSALKYQEYFLSHKTENKARE